MAFRNEPSSNRISRPRQDSLIVLTKRSAWAFKFGELSGNFTDSTGLHSFQEFLGERWSRSWIKYRLPIRKPSVASLRFLAI